MNRRDWMLSGLGIAGAAGVARWAMSADEDSPGHEARLKKLGIELPKVEPPKDALFVPAVRVGDMLYVSGHVPRKDGELVTGRVGVGDFDEKKGAEAARLVGLIVLAVVRKELGSLDKVVRLVKTLGMVNCRPEFRSMPKVIDGFSRLMVQVFGEKAGKGTRSAVGMVSLPFNVPVEVECQFQVK